MKHFDGCREKNILLKRCSFYLKLDKSDKIQCLDLLLQI